MRQSTALLVLFFAGCSAAPNADTDAAREFILRMYPNTEFLLVEGPEYANVPQFPIGSSSDKMSDKPAICAVRIRYRAQLEEGRRMTDDTLVWIGSDHKALNWSGKGGSGEDWRRYVQSFAKK